MVLNTDGRTDGGRSYYMPRPLSWQGHNKRVNNEVGLISEAQQNSSSSTPSTTREKALRPARRTLPKNTEDLASAMKHLIVNVTPKRKSIL